MGQRTAVKLKWVVVACFMNSTGASFLWPLTTMYVHNYLHQTLTTAGVVTLIMSAAMIFGNYLGGHLFDHWRPYLTAVIGAGIAVAAVVLLIVFHGWPIFGVLMSLVSFGDGINMTITNAYGSAVTGHGQRYVFNIIYIAYNLGIVIGTILVGVLFPIGIVITFVVTSIFYLALLLVTLFTFNVNFTKVEKRAQSKTKERNKVSSTGHHQRIILIRLICLNLIVAYLAYSLWESIMSVHITNMGIPFFVYSLLWTINGLLIVCGQPLVNMLSPYVRLSTQIIVGLIIFASSFVILIFSHSLAGFTISMIILTIGDMLSLPGAPAWVAMMTTLDEAGHYQGLVSMTSSIGRAIGPLYGGFAIDEWNYRFLFTSCVAMMAVSIVAVVIYMRWMQRRQN